MADKSTPEPASVNVKDHKHLPGEGIRSLRTTSLFRAVNFELYAKPNMVIMVIGTVCFAGVLGYITYMRSKYEGQGYYAAVQEDGSKIYTKKKSKWN